jgi:hypothetical protein
MGEKIFDSYDWGVMAVLFAIGLDLSLLLMRRMKSAAAYTRSRLKCRREWVIACVTDWVSDWDMFLALSTESDGAGCDVLQAAPISSLSANRRKEVLALALVRFQGRDAEEVHASVDMAALHDFFRRSVYFSPYLSKWLDCD